MHQSSFTAVVSARLDPILAPRGFPYAAHHNGVAAWGEPAVHNPDSVIFHCDGVEAVAAVLARYPSWSTRLRSVDAGPLDQWVDGLAVMLDSYFHDLEARAPDVER